MKTAAFTPAARKAFRGLTAQVRADVTAKLDRYLETGAGNVTALTGQPGARLRIGDYRLVFIETETEIQILAIGHRRDIYR